MISSTATPMSSQAAELLQWLSSHALLAQRSNERHCSQLVGYAIIYNHALPLSVSDRGVTTTRSSSSCFKFGFGPHTIVFCFNNHISLLCARCACCRYCDQSLWVICVPSKGLLPRPTTLIQLIVCVKLFSLYVVISRSDTLNTFGGCCYHATPLLVVQLSTVSFIQVWTQGAASSLLVSCRA